MANHPGRKAKARELKAEFGAWLAAMRARAGLTQTQAAKLLGATTRTWQMWEAGDRGMPHSALELWIITCIVDGLLPPTDDGARMVRTTILASIAR